MVKHILLPERPIEACKERITRIFSEGYILTSASHSLVLCHFQ